MEEYDLLPEEIKNILDTYDENKSLYQECQRIKEELEQVNWTCEYGLDGQIYDIKHNN